MIFQIKLSELDDFASQAEDFLKKSICRTFGDNKSKGIPAEDYGRYLWSEKM